MINTDFRTYNYFTFGNDSGYGQPQISTYPEGVIKMAINILSQTTQDNVLYQDASYIGLTNDTKVNDAYVIEYEGRKLKVLYINSKGRYKQVFMRGM